MDRSPYHSVVPQVLPMSSHISPQFSSTFLSIDDQTTNQRVEAITHATDTSLFVNNGIENLDLGRDDKYSILQSAELQSQVRPIGIPIDVPIERQIKQSRRKRKNLRKSLRDNRLKS